MHTRAEWIVRRASDISRGGVWEVGDITPLMKIHGGGGGNLHALCAMGIPGEYYERGLLHTFIDYEEPAPWLNALVDPMDGEGNVHVSDGPGLGWDINWDYIEGNTMEGP